MIAALLGLVVALGLWRLLSRSTTTRRAFLLGPSLPGLVLTFAGMLVIPWVQFGPTDCLERNTEWLSNQAEWLDRLRSFEPFSTLLTDSSIPTGAEIQAKFDDPEEQSIIAAYRSTGYLTGWQESRFVQPHDPTLTLAFLIGSLTCCVLALVNLFRLITRKNGPRILFFILQGLLAVSLVYVLAHVAVIDTLAARDDFRLRLLLSFLEARSGAGPYAMTLGWALIMLSVIYDCAPDPEKTVSSLLVDDDFTGPYS